MKISKLRVATLFTEEQVSLSKVLINGTWKYLADPAAPLIFDLEFLLNTTVELVESTYIGQYPNGTLKGMGAEVISGEVDFGGDASMFLPYRIQALTFLHPIHSERYFANFKPPHTLTSEHRLILKPFTNQIWLSILVMLIIFVITSIACTRILNNSSKQNNNTSSAPSAGEIVVWAVASICNRSYNLKHFGVTSFKIILFSGMLFGTIIFSIYSAFIVSFLTIKVNHIKSFADLISHGYTIYSRKDFPLGVFIQKKSEIERLEQIASRLYQSQIDSVLQVYLSDEIKSRVAFVELQSSFYKESKKLSISDQEMCKVSQISSVSKYPLGMFVKKNSELKEILNQKILHLLQNGLIQRYLKHASDLVMPRCIDDIPTMDELQPLRLSSFHMVFIFLISINFFILILLFFEVFVLNSAKYSV